MLRTHLGQVEGDLANPGTFRNQYQHQNQIRTTQTPPATDSPVIKPQQSCTPALDGTGQQNGDNNPSAAGTPMPQNQNNETNQTNNENGNTNMNGGGTGTGTGSGNGSTSESGGQGRRP